MAETIQIPVWGDVIIENGVPSTEFQIWLDQITTAVNNMPPLTGTGSPEGAVAARTGRWYVDTTTPGTGIYLKESGDGNTGWIQRS